MNKLIDGRRRGQNNRKISFLKLDREKLVLERARKPDMCVCVCVLYFDTPDMYILHMCTTQKRKIFKLTL